MTHTITMSPEEYDELVTKQNEPSKLLQESYNNVKKKLDEAYKKIDELNTSLSMYIIGGVKPRTESIKKTKPTTSKRWTKEDILFIKASVSAEYFVFDVAKKLERTESSIRSKAISMGYRIKNKRIVK